MTHRGSCGCHSHNGFLTAKGLREAAQRELKFSEPLAVGTCGLYLDKVDSVSASELTDLHWDDDVIEEQARRASHGA